MKRHSGVMDSSGMSPQPVAYGRWRAWVAVGRSSMAGRRANRKAAWWAAFSAYRNLMEGGETAFIPPFLGYQVGVENTPNLLGGFGVEVFCFVGSLLWISGLGLDKFSTVGGKG